MPSYEPENFQLGGLEPEVAEFIFNEFHKIAAAFLGVGNVLLEELNAEPGKPREGMVVLADGSNWNPGSGAGFYGFRDSTWKLLESQASTLSRVKSYSFKSFAASSGTRYIAGFYELVSADLNLDQGSTTGTMGGANAPYAAHAILVAGGPGVASGGTGGVGVITVSGTSVTDEGVRTTSDSEVIVSDTTAMTTDQYFETTLKWLGQVTYTLSQNGNRTTFDADFNVGFVKYEDWGNQDFTINTFEVVGLAGANDASFDISLCTHSADNWTYDAASFTFPANIIVSMATVHSTESDLDNKIPFAFKDVSLSVSITGSADQPTTTVPNGYLIQIVTGANGSVQFLDAHVSGTID